MGLVQSFRKMLWSVLLPPDELFDTARREYVQRLATLYDYYQGAHERQIKTKPGQADDNLTLNFIQLVVERSISMLFGGGVEFDLPGEPVEQEDENGQTVKIPQPNQEYIDRTWTANKKPILMHKLGQFGGIYGTPFLKIVPDGVRGRDGELYPRLVPLNPLYMTVETAPEDIDFVTKYVTRFNTLEDDQETARKEETEPVYSAITDDDGNVIGAGDVTAWTISQYKSNRTTGGRWELVGQELWDYPFPPIHHWQNLPRAGNVYGASDIDNIIGAQDRANFVNSNVSKIIRYHAHPKTWGRMVGGSSNVSWGADEMVVFNSPEALIANLEMQSDLVSSRAFALDLRQAIFDLSRTVDITSMSDKLGSLTNFGLRVLFMDSLAKLKTKQELYGDAFEEINYRLLSLNDSIPDKDPGAVVWSDPLPQDDQLAAQSDQFELDNELASRETVATRRGLDYEQEAARIEQERETRQAGQTNLGDLLIQNFNRGEQTRNI